MSVTIDDAVFQKLFVSLVTLLDKSLKQEQQLEYVMNFINQEENKEEEVPADGEGKQQ